MEEHDMQASACQYPASYELVFDDKYLQIRDNNIMLRVRERVQERRPGVGTERV